MLMNVDEAIEQILAQITPLPGEMIPIGQGLGRITSQSVISDEDLPPFANSSMDGYAVRAQDITQVPMILQVVMDVPAGVFPSETLHAGQAARIMTGAPIPIGADAVIPVEETDSAWDLGGPPPKQVEIRRSAKIGASIRPIGENVQRGQTVLNAGRVLRPQDIGMLASIGQPTVYVTRQPRVAILTTGDELLTADQPLTPGKIRDANSPMLAAMVTQAGAHPIVLPIAPDRLEAVRALFLEAIAFSPDVIISSAGVSVGAADFVRTVLAELGEVNFWRINLRPGKPLAFGQLRGIPFFGLPGNPVSAAVTFDVIVRPALDRLLGRVSPLHTIIAEAGEDFTSDGRRSYLRVTLSQREGKWIAHLTGTQSSGALMSLVQADGLMIVPEGVIEVQAGTPLTVRVWN
ncbi:MAG: molybdopterin molybdotransferase MoeA [Anaerolineae bacterium]|jgi:molybdopterin molybdotransferase|nr:molybdopterin molybdotransferase MoeA [Anaerolineae bacterium]